MKIQFISDLHLEFTKNRRYLNKHPLEAAGEILIIAGDTGYLGTKEYDNYPLWDWASKNFKEVFVLLGNHEFYAGYDLGKIPENFVGEIRKNIHYYYNGIVEYGDITFIFSTLWTKISEESKKNCEEDLLNFSEVVYNGKKFTVDDYNNEHEKCVKFLKNAVENCKSKHKIVVTHHVPTFEIVAPEFKDSKIKDCFNADLTEYIKNSDIDYWIFGHIHRNIEKQIGKTKLICNQLGYTFEGEGKDFSNNRCIEI